jgi:hypothetical protein
MKNITLVALAVALALAPLQAFAQQTAAGTPPAKPEQTCPCSDYAFVPKTEKAKAVAAWWDARRKLHSASIVGTFALFGALLSNGQSNGINEASELVGQAQSEMMTARDKAEKLHGLESDSRDPDAIVKVTLLKDVDYTIQR